MRIRVEGIAQIGDLADDCAAAPAKFRRLGYRAIRGALQEGTEDAKRIAQKRAGPHGSNYHKRISFDQTGLSGEFGPSAPGTDYVGVSGAEGAMRDLNTAADRAGPRLQKRVALMAERLPW